MVDPEIIQADVKDAGNNRLKIEWSYRTLPVTLPYFVSKSMLETYAKAVRQALKGLVDKYVEVEKRNNQKGAEENKERPRAGKELRELARAGHNLYKALFYPDKASTGDPIRLKEWLAQLTARLASEGTQLQINFTVDSLVHIPWGLIYDADPNGLSGVAEDDALVTYQDFWCLKHKLTSVYNRILLIGMDYSNSPHSISFLSVNHKSIYEKALSQLDESCEERDKPLIETRRRIIELLEQFGESSFTSEDFFAKWRNHGEKLRLLYVYCHANGSNLALDFEDEITSDDFSLNTVLPSLTQNQSTCLVFFNGCDTAIGDSKGGFLEATGGSVFCGFIGTETKVPDIFALRFGIDFLYHFFCKGRPVFRIMDHLRTQHWPLGLIYSTYCPPHFSIGQAVHAPNLTLEGNFSEIPLLGTSSLL